MKKKLCCYIFLPSFSDSSSFSFLLFSFSSSHTSSSSFTIFSSQSTSSTFLLLYRLLLYFLLLPVDFIPFYTLLSSPLLLSTLPTLLHLLFYSSISFPYTFLLYYLLPVDFISFSTPLYLALILSSPFLISSPSSLLHLFSYSFISSYFLLHFICPFLIKTAVTEPEHSTPLISKTSDRYDSDTVQSTSNSQNLS
jgi:hypothetical protein